jgi:phage head maturation protease
MSDQFTGRGLTKVSATKENEFWWGWMDLHKIDAEQRIIEGFATTEEIDDEAGIWQGQMYKGDVVSAEAVKEALPDYMEWANLREMHDLSAVGVVIKAELIDGDVEVDGRTYKNPLHIVAKVVDDEAWRKVKEGVYKGFSIGGKVIKAVLEKITGQLVRKVVKLMMVEISLVDRPRNPGARILLWKSFSLDEQTENIRSAWYKQFRSSVVPKLKSDEAWVKEVFSDRVIVHTQDGLYAYAFTVDASGEIVFDQPPVKVRVEYLSEGEPTPGAGEEPVQKASYPWDKCVREQTERYGSEETAKKVCGMIRSKYGHKAATGDDLPANAEPDIVYDGELDSILVEIETELGISPKKVKLEGGTKVTKLQNTKVQKVAVDPSKAVSMLQALRDEAELNGDLDGASLFSQAIALSMQAGQGAPEEPEPETETETETPEGGEETPPEAGEEEMLLAARNGNLKKAGRIFSGTSATAMHGVIQALAKLLAGSGDETANKILGCYAPPAELPAEGGEAAKIAGAKDLQKAFQPALDGFQKVLQDFSQRLESLERLPAPGGPVLRAVDKTIAGQEPPETEEGSGTHPSVAELRKLAALEPNPIKRAEIARQLFIAEQKTVKK